MVVVPWPMISICEPTSFVVLMLKPWMFVTGASSSMIAMSAPVARLVPVHAGLT